MIFPCALWGFRISQSKDRLGVIRMADKLPEYYFRVRENGAFVFRLDTENRQRRIEMHDLRSTLVRKKADRLTKG